jgi:hypothetical protein
MAVVLGLAPSAPSERARRARTQKNTIRPIAIRAAAPPPAAPPITAGEIGGAELEPEFGAGVGVGAGLGAGAGESHVSQDTEEQAQEYADEHWQVLVPEHHRQPLIELQSEHELTDEQVGAGAG